MTAASNLSARDAVAVATFTAELLSEGAGVGVVEATISACARADVGAAATAAAHQPGEQVVARAAVAQRHVLAAFTQEALRALEAELIDERLVQSGKALAAPEHAAEVGLVRHTIFGTGVRRVAVAGQLRRSGLACLVGVAVARRVVSSFVAWS